MNNYYLKDEFVLPQVEKPLYLVPTNEFGKIKELFKDKNEINFNEFQEFFIKLHPHLEKTPSFHKTCILEAFDDLDVNNDHSLDFDRFLVAYAFARSAIFRAY